MGYTQYTMMKDDPMLREHPDIEIFPGRAKLMEWWYDINRKLSDRYVNLPYARLISETDIDWEAELEDSGL